MANTAAVCSSFKQELMLAYHNFGTGPNRASVTAADTFKLALFLATASLSGSTTAYSTTGELAATGNYTAGGNTVSNGTAPSLSGTTAIWTPSANSSWTTLTSSGAFDCALLYNSTQGNRSVAVFTFSSQSVTAGNFTLTMPTNDASNALIRIA
jgi:hypothetical protein